MVMAADTKPRLHSDLLRFHLFKQEKDKGFRG